MRSFENGVAVVADVSPSLVVRHAENNVWAVSSVDRQGAAPKKKWQTVSYQNMFKFSIYSHI